MDTRLNNGRMKLNARRKGEGWTEKEGKLVIIVHDYTIRDEAPRGGLVLEAAEEVLDTNVLQLGVVLEGVNSALPLDGVGALNVVVVRKEELLGAMKLAAAANRLLGTIVPPDPDLHVIAMVCLDFLHARHIRRLIRVRRAHENAVPHYRDDE